MKLLVVGGGPIGLAAALIAARRGLEVVLLDEHRSWPIDKACGEGLMPPAVAALRALGVVLPDEHCSPFAGIRYVDGDVVAEGRFPEGPGLGVRRLGLSAALAEACRAAGVELVGGQRITSWSQDGRGVLVTTPSDTFRGDWLVGADGLHSRLRQGIPLRQGPVRQGLRRHYVVDRVPDMVEVHWSDGVEAYVTPVGPGRVGVALLHGDDHTPYDELLARFPGLTLGEPIDQIRGAGPFAVHPASPHVGRLLLVGDAAGYLDAITGEGITLGIAGAHAVVDSIVAGTPERWPAAHRRIARRHVAFTTLLLWIARRPALRHRVVAALARNPVAFGTCLGFNTGYLSLAAALPAFARIALAVPAAAG